MTQLTSPSRAMDAVMRKDRQAWLDCFTVDAILQDPVGGSPVDPEGRGLVGHDAIAGFWDAMIAPSGAVRFDVREEHRSGASVARVATVRVEMGRQALSYDGVFVYDLADDGRIRHLRGYFQLPALA